MVTTLTPTMDDKEPKTSPEVNKSNETTTIEQVPTLKMVSHQSNSIYRSILLAYWLVVLICIPIWWSMTSIERLSLPNSRILHQEEAVKDLRFNVDVLIQTKGSNGPSTGLLSSVKAAINECQTADSEAWRGMDLKIMTELDQARGSEIYDVLVHFGEKDREHQVYDRHLDFYAADADTGSELGSLLCHLLNPTAGKPSDQKVTQYSPKLRLAFSLLNEDIVTSGQRGWAVENNVAKIILPYLDRLSEIHNFTIESQVQYYAPLAFEPSKKKGPTGDYYALGEDELKIFINSAEWTLSSKITNDPVLHFILFVPAAKHKPLLLYDESANQPLSTTGFIIPQWGGVIVYNPGHPSAPKAAAQIFALFRSQLLSLLGVPALPAKVRLTVNPDGVFVPLSKWQIDALMRRRTRENMEGSAQTLTSIIKLVDKLENMPVGMDVKGDVLRALEELEQMTASDSTPRTAVDLFTHARDALTYSSRAFFNPGMVGQLYFPAEHKYAIYMLFAPASMPLIVTLIKEIREWRKAKKARQKTE